MIYFLVFITIISRSFFFFSFCCPLPLCLCLQFLTAHDFVFPFHEVLVNTSQRKEKEKKMHVRKNKFTNRIEYRIVTLFIYDDRFRKIKREARGDLNAGGRE